MSTQAKVSEYPIDERGAIPSTPGVYCFHDRHGAILYVGKSVSLRQRVASYLRERSGPDDERIRRMVYNSRTVSIHETGSELSALLLEDALIKRHRPAYNKRQKEYLENRYLHVAGGDYPFLEVVDNPDGHDPANLFGPFRDRYFVQDLIDVIQLAFGVRSCTEAVPSSRCANHEIGLCAGPCRDGMSAADYASSVDAARRFLEGDESGITPRLEHIMEDAAERLDFEKAAAMRDRIAFCEKYCGRQRFAERFRTGVLFVREAGADRTHLFVEGAHIQQDGPLDESTITNDIAGLHSRAPGDPRFVMDRAHIVFTWLRRNGSTSFHFLD